MIEKFPTNEHNPPRWATKFLHWYCPERLIEGIEGDLLEEYENLISQEGLKKANRKFIWTVFRFFRPGIIFRNRKVNKLIIMGLYKNHLLVAWRSMLKYRFYSAINILGLALAVSFVFLSYLFIYNELSYDNFHRNKDKIYRLNTHMVDRETGEQISRDHSGVTPIPLAPELGASIPEIREYARYGSSSGTINHKETPYEEVISLVDPSFLRVFSFPFIAGDRNTALDDANNVVITKEMAIKYFEGLDPVGGSLEITMNDSTRIYFVSGVIDNMESVSSIPFDFLIAFERFGMLVPERLLTSYHVAFIESYVMFDSPVKEDVSQLLSEAIAKDTERSRARLIVDIQPLMDIHLNPEIEGIARMTNPQKLWIMSALALLVLIIATINFITLSTGHALNRVKEIGLRKTLGAFKSSLRIQLIFESFLVTVISGIMGLGLTKIIVPFFNSLLGSSIVFDPLPIHLGFFLLIAIAISIISGGIQSTALLGFRPVDALKGKKVFTSKESWLNQGLIIVQFSVSIMLIIGTVVIRNQLHFIQNKDLGYDDDRLVQINMHSSDDTEFSKKLVERYRAEAMTNPQIISVGASMNSFRDPWTKLSFLQVDETSEDVYFNQIDKEYLSTLDIKLKEGTGFISDGVAGSGIIVNQSLVDHFAWVNPFEMQIPGKNFEGTHQIIGIVEDFHFSSLHNKIEPLILALDDDPIASGITGLSTYVWPSNLHQLIVRIGPGDLSNAIDFLERSWMNVNPDKPFTYDFVDEILAQNYEEEARWRKLIDAASIFALVIAWMGLLGLTRLNVQKRIKEIGIRKVMGSSLWDVISLLSRRFMVLVSISMIISFPVAWIVLEKWLESFSYRIDLNILVFIAAGIAVLVISMISVSLQTTRAARANPVDSLRYE